jgi:Na+/melibiose symporter-like transporter
MRGAAGEGSMDTRAGRVGAYDIATFSAGALPVGALVTTLGVYLTNFYAADVGIALETVGTAFMAVRLLDLVLDPILGVAMDRTKTRFGRFRPWLAASAPILLISVWMLYLPAEGVGPFYLVGWLLLLYAGYSMLTLSQAAWGAVLVAEYHQRSRVYGWIQAVGVVGALGVLLVPLLLPKFWPAVPIHGVPLMGAFILAAVIVGAIVTVAFAPEPAGKDGAHKERFSMQEYWALATRPDMLRILGADVFCTLGPAITAPMYLFFFQQARGYTADQTTILLFLYIAAGLAAPTFWSMIARRFSKHRTVRIASFAYVLAQVSLLLLPKAQPLYMAFAMFSVGFTASAFGFLVRAMAADVIDEVRLESGKDRTAALYALITSTGKFGSTISVGVAYYILPLFGFIAKRGVVNTPDAIWGLEACYLAPPVICVLIGGLCMFGYRLDEKRHAEIRVALEADAAIAAAAGE